jgi:RimJ/RimL family protein N-acetyltransferase
MTIRIEVATPVHYSFFQSWRKQDRLEWMTCRPVVNGVRIPPAAINNIYAVFVDNVSEPVGKFSYFDLNPRNRSAEFGYVIHPDMRGRGLGKQMLQACISQIFQATDLNKLYCQTGAFNLPSIKLLEHLGFHRDGVLREHHELDGVLHDDCIYSLLRREWEVQPWS